MRLWFDNIGFVLLFFFCSESNEIDIAPNTRVGTRRYMAPEVLDETLNKASFEAFKAADIYSLGLVLWEMARRCNTAGSTSPIITDESQEKLVTYGADEYQQPYFDCVPCDPSFDDMYNVVCVKKVRPDIQSHWIIEEVRFFSLCKLTRTNLRELLNIDLFLLNSL